MGKQANKQANKQTQERKIENYHNSHCEGGGAWTCWRRGGGECGGVITQHRLKWSLAVNFYSSHYVVMINCWIFAFLYSLISIKKLIILKASKHTYSSRANQRRKNRCTLEAESSWWLSCEPPSHCASFFLQVSYYTLQWLYEEKTNQSGHNYLPPTMAQLSCWVWTR